MGRKPRTVEDLELNRDFWAGRRVFLTGHTGFKGSWMALVLHRLGAVVSGYALPPSTDPALYDMAGIEGVMAISTFADIRDPVVFARAMGATEPDIVVHMAAQALVGAGYDDPVGTFSTNVMGTVNLFEAVWALGRPVAVVNVTSDKCYDNKEWIWPYRENDPMGGRDPYSASKGCAELVSAAYSASFLGKAGIRLATARAGNVIGGGDWSEARLVPDVLKAFDAGLPLQLRSPGSVRPWQHVLEPVVGYLVLAQALAEGRDVADGWNFGPSQSDVRPVGEVVDLLHAALGASVPAEQAPAAFHEAGLLTLDSSKARAHLGWRPRWDLETAVAKTAEWHLAVSGGASAQDVCLAQIDAYLDEAA